MWISRKNYEILRVRIDELKADLHDERMRNIFLKTDNSKIDGLKKQIKELEEQVAEAEKKAREAAAELATKEKLYEILNKCFEAQKKQADDAIAASKEKDKLLEELRDSFNIVCKGMYCQDNIEFAAVKTYRGGWAFACHDGVELTDLNDASYVHIFWNRGERVSVEANR